MGRKRERGERKEEDGQREEDGERREEDEERKREEYGEREKTYITGFCMVGFIGVGLSKPHTSVIALVEVCVCLLACGHIP